MNKENLSLRGFGIPVFHDTFSQYDGVNFILAHWDTVAKVRNVKDEDKTLVRGYLDSLTDREKPYFDLNVCAEDSAEMLESLYRIFPVDDRYKALNMNANDAVIELIGMIMAEETGYDITYGMYPYPALLIPCMNPWDMNEKTRNVSRETMSDIFKEYTKQFNGYKYDAFELHNRLSVY